MPEGSNNEIILISISWQALQRARKGNKRTMSADCTVALGFMGFYIEASITHIIDKMNMMTDMKNYFPRKDYLGVQDKLAWFYNRYIAESKAQDKDQFKRKFKVIKRQLFKRFLGFKNIYEFRNKISHGVIDTSMTNLDNVEKLRDQAKLIVDDLYMTAQDEGYLIPRNITYDEAIGFHRSDTHNNHQNLNSDASS